MNQRDITGAIRPAGGHESDRSSSGALYFASGNPGMKFGGGSYKWRKMQLDANRESDNPMSGHANGGDVHPYSMRVLCLIVY